MPNINDNEDFPALSFISRKQYDQGEREKEIVEHLTQTMTVIIEKATEQMFELLNQKFEQLAKRLLERFKIPNEEISDDEEECKLTQEEASSDSQQQQIHQTKHPQRE